MTPAEIEGVPPIAPVARSPRWIIEPVPALVIPLLQQAGGLPAMPVEIAAMRERPGSRQPTAADGGALSWAVAYWGDDADAWLGPPHPVGGAIGYRDVFDFHTSVDVREIVYVVGAATAALIRWARSTTRRPLMGGIDIGNERMARALTALGYKPTRVVYEDLG